MARTYSAIMALLAMLVVLLRGLKSGSGLEGTVELALVWMALFGAIGLVVGRIAHQTVDDSILTQVQAELTAFAEEQESETPPSST